MIVTYGRRPDPSVLVSVQRSIRLHASGEARLSVGVTADIQACAQRAQRAEPAPWRKMLLLYKSAVLGNDRTYGVLGLARDLDATFSPDPRYLAPAGDDAPERLRGVPGPYYIYMLIA
jgi:hypothetical protein